MVARRTTATRRPHSRPRVGADTARRVERAGGRLATQAMGAMEQRLPWFAAMPARQRSWVGLVAQAGIAAFVAWLRDPAAGQGATNEVFGAAPRQLTRAITLQQSVDLVRVTVDVVEAEVAALAAPGEEATLREAVLRFSREVAFATAGVYARAAEERGAWDTRLEALVVDAVLRNAADDEVRSRAAALGWSGAGPVCVVVGRRPAGTGYGPSGEPTGADGRVGSAVGTYADPDAVLDSLQRAARLDSLDVLAAVQGDLLVVVLGGAGRAHRAVERLLPEFGAGPVVIGPPVPELAAAARSADAAMAGLRAAAAWPGAPRPVDAADLLPERAIDGDEEARRILLDEVYAPLVAGGPALLDTLSTYVERTGSIEGTARALFVHPNTVRYRLRRAEELTGWTPTDPRQALTLRVALVLGRLAAARTE